MASDLNLPTHQIQVHSLASCVSPYEVPQTRTATVSIHTPAPNLKEMDFTYPRRLEADGQTAQVVIDTHFRGLTPLNDVSSRDSVLDCIAISGPSLYPFSSWEKGTTSISQMWIRDKLAISHPRVRFMLYGHPYDTQNIGVQETIDSLSSWFLQELRSVGRLGSSTPLLILAHSVGGIILKHALIALSNADPSTPMLGALRGVVFLGVPTQRTSVQYLQSMIVDGRFRILAWELASNSAVLEDLDIKFGGVATVRRIRVYSAFERIPTHLVAMDTVGNWIVTDRREILVDGTVAIQKGTLRRDAFQMLENHPGLISLDDTHPEMGAFRAVLQEHLDELMENASSSASPQKELPPPSAPPSGRFITAIRALSKHIFSPSAPKRTSSHAEPRHTDNVGSTNMGPTPSSGNRTEDPLADSTKRQDILRALHFEEVDLRERQIDGAFEDTFNWAWSHDIPLSDWLIHNEPVFWIRGTPGSGKSTLIKYILHHPRWELHRSQRSSTGAKRISASFFFHARGSALQTSLKGLLQTVLSQLIAADSGIEELVFRQLMKRGLSQGGDLDTNQLQQAFEDVLRQKKTAYQLYLFFDALDEYAGKPETMVEFLEWILERSQGSMTTVKICFSSRPWTCFLDNFDNCPGFRIHEYTHEDILTYIRGRLREVLAMRLLLDYPETMDAHRLHSVIEHVADKAEGVFIWVVLVMNDLVKKSTNATLDDMDAIVASCPSELSNFYTRLFRTVDPAKLRDCLIMVEIVLREGSVPFHHFAGIFTCAPVKTAQDFPNTSDEIDYAEIRRKIADCQGLLQIVAGKDNEQGQKEQVQFLHQTLKEYASTPDFSTSILGRSNPGLTENGYTYIAKYMVFCTLRAVQRPGHRFHLATTYTEGIWRNWNPVYLAELTTGQSLGYLWNSLDTLQFTTQLKLAVPLSESKHPVLAFAVAYNIMIYVEECLEVESSPTRIYDDFPLLHFAGSGEMVSLLLHHGADINATPWQAQLRATAMGYFQKDAGGTAWQNFWKDTRYGNPYRRSHHFCSSLAREFLKAGQSPNAVIDTKSGGTALHHLFYRLDEYDESDGLKEITSLFLDYGAEINALDCGGHTILDICMASCCQTIPPIPAFCELNAWLLSHGAWITPRSQGFARRLVWFFHLFPQEDDWDLAERLDIVSVLKSTSGFASRIASRFDPKEMSRDRKYRAAMSIFKKTGSSQYTSIGGRGKSAYSKI